MKTTKMSIASRVGAVFLAAIFTMGMVTAASAAPAESGSATAVAAPEDQTTITECVQSVYGNACESVTQAPYFSYGYAVPAVPYVYAPSYYAYPSYYTTTYPYGGYNYGGFGRGFHHRWHR